MTSQAARRGIASLVCLNLGLAGALAWAGSRLAAGSAVMSEVLAGTNYEEAAVAALVSHGAGVWDSFPDPDVGRILQPGIDQRVFADMPTSSNSWGLREREFGAKPEGVVRVVLLGDSFVFGQGVEADERFGVFLEQFLNERAERVDGDPVRVECLHIGLSSWNLRSECSYMRRSLDLIDPDLVVQLVLPNDLGDSRSIRGFGSKAAFSTQVRERSSGMLDTSTLVPDGGGRRVPNHFALGVDWESRRRYEESAELVRRLAEAVRARGAAYLFLPRWTHFQPRARQYFAPVLWDKELAYVSDEFVLRDEYWVSPNDFHWNRAGNEVMAKFLYGLIEERGLLPELVLPDWPEADDWVAGIHGTGLEEARKMRTIVRRIPTLGIARVINSGEPTKQDLRQIYAGFHRGGVTPYTSMLLAGPGVGELVLHGVRIGHPGLEGEARVYVDEFEVGTFSIAGVGVIVESFPLPEPLAEREFLNVRIVSDDYVRAIREANYMSCWLRRVFLTP